MPCGSMVMRFRVIDDPDQHGHARTISRSLPMECRLRAFPVHPARDNPACPRSPSSALADGLSCAWRLARDGHHVALHDLSTEPREASWAAAGMLAPHHEAEQPTPLWRLCRDGLERWPDFLGELALPANAVDWQAGRRLDPAADLAELDRLESGLRWLRATGVDVLRLSPAAYARACPGAAAGIGAIWLPGAQIDPRAAARPAAPGLPAGRGHRPLRCAGERPRRPARPDRGRGLARRG